MLSLRVTYNVDSSMSSEMVLSQKRLNLNLEGCRYLIFIAAMFHGVSYIKSIYSKNVIHKFKCNLHRMMMNSKIH